MKDLVKFIKEQDRAVEHIKKINNNVSNRRAVNGHAKGPNITKEEFNLVKHFVLAFRLPCYLGGEGGFNQFVFKVYNPPICPGVEIDKSCIILSTGSRDMDVDIDNRIKAFLCLYEIAGSDAFRETARVCGIKESETLYSVFDLCYTQLDKLSEEHRCRPVRKSLRSLG